MNKPWYAHDCKTLQEFWDSHNIAIAYEFFWMLSVKVGLNFDKNHLLRDTEILKNEVIDWYAENEPEK